MVAGMPVDERLSLSAVDRLCGVDVSQGDGSSNSGAQTRSDERSALFLLQSRFSKKEAR